MIQVSITEDNKAFRQAGKGKTWNDYSIREGEEEEEVPDTIYLVELENTTFCQTYEMTEGKPLRLERMYDNSIEAVKNLNASLGKNLPQQK